MAIWYQWRKEDDSALGESAQFDVADKICTHLANESVLPEGNVVVNLFEMPSEMLMRRYSEGNIEEIETEPKHKVGSGHGASANISGPKGHEMQNAWEKTQKLQEVLTSWGLPKSASLIPHYLLFYPGEKSPRQWTDQLDIAQTWPADHPTAQVVDSRTGKPAKV